MMVLLLIVLAAAALGTGVAADSEVLVYVALGLSALAAVLVVAARVLPALRAVEDAPDDLADGDPGGGVPPVAVGIEAAEVAEPSVAGEQPVVFVVGRTTFHRADCAQVEGKAQSSAQRDQLEAGGMSPCRRCLPA